MKTINDRMILLVTLDVSDDVTIRITDHYQDVVSRSQTFIAFPFTMALPPVGILDPPDKQPIVELYIPSSPVLIVSALQLFNREINTHFEVVSSETPDIVEFDETAMSKIYMK